MTKPEVGSTANQYEILAKIAEGGMAEIFLARLAGVAGVERYVVLKRILRERASDVQFVQMFLDEARLAAQLQHPNIAQVFDVGKLGDSFFFTMEYVHGETVRGILRRARMLVRTLPIDVVLTIAAGTVAGLHHAHERIGVDGHPLGIVHRDVSPSNLMVSFEGTVKVVDFGVAKASERLSETRSGAVKGKIGYLAPEQFDSQRGVDRRCDLFALGIVMWEMLTLERLYKRPTDFQSMTAIVNDPPIAPSTKRPEVPPELDAIVLKLLAKSPDDRYQSAADVLEALETIAARTGSVLSATALGRELREMFGARPEPWRVLAPAIERDELITVASAPAPQDIVHTNTSSIDAKLAALRSAFVAPSAETPVPGARTDLETSREQPTKVDTGQSSFRQPRKRLGGPVVIAIAATIVALLVVAFVLASSRTPHAVAIAHDAPIRSSDADAATAAVIVAATKDAAGPDAPVEQRAIDVELAWRDGRTADVVAACHDAVVADHAPTCVLAACTAGKSESAKQWWSSVPTAQRTRVAAACRKHGIELVAQGPRKPPVATDCLADPLSCQH